MGCRVNNNGHLDDSPAQGQTLALMNESQSVAPQGSFVCTHVSYVVPDWQFHFTERARLVLAG
jgi:hypothetical protein